MKRGRKARTSTLHVTLFFMAVRSYSDVKRSAKLATHAPTSAVKNRLLDPAWTATDNSHTSLTIDSPIHSPIPVASRIHPTRPWRRKPDNISLMEEELKRTATPSSLVSSLPRPSLTSRPRT